MTVRLTRIYTRTGDAGETHLGDMSRVAKTDARLVAYADVDETNSVLGVALALGSPSAEVAELLAGVQNDLFDVGADLSTPVTAAPEHPPLRVTAAYTERLEAACDEHNAALPALASFVLPGVGATGEDDALRWQRQVGRGGPASCVDLELGAAHPLVGPHGQRQPSV